jgi:hypothetical protein
MNQTQTLRTLQRQQWRALERLMRRSYREGFQAGLARAHGQGRRGRTVRADATVAGLTRLIERHFGLDRYGFEVRIVHAASKKRVALRDQIAKYRLEE